MASFDQIGVHSPGTPLSVEDAVRLIEGYVRHYNEVRLHSAIGYVTPTDKLSGRDKQIFDDRDRKLDEARSSPEGGSCRAASSWLTRSRSSCSCHRVDLRWRVAWAEDRAPWRRLQQSFTCPPKGGNSKGLQSTR